MVLHPRRGKYAKKVQVPEATKEKLSAPEALSQNTTRTIIRNYY